MNLIKVLLATALCGAASTALAVNTDINGLKLGMQAPAANAVLKKMNPKFVITDLVQDNKKVMGVRAFSGGQGMMAQGLDLATALFDDSGAAWYIGRRQRYAGDARPSNKTMKDALIEKYGPPSYAQSSSMMWHFVRGSAAPVKMSNFGGPCNFEKKEVMMVADLTLAIPKEFSPKCSLSISAEWSNEGEMVDSLMITMFDAARMHDQLTAASNAAANAAAQKAAAEKAKAVKPQL